MSRLSELESWTSSPVHVPALKPPTEASAIDGIDDFGEFSNDLYEWLSLIQLESPRVSTNDSIDPFLSRYTTPQAPENSSPEPLEKLSWHGFISPKWAHEALVQTVLSVSPKSWFAFAVSGFGESLPAGSRDCTILRIPGRSSEYMLWEVERN